MEGHPYQRRLVEPRLRRLFAHFPAVVVSGARQVGKSTLLTHVFPELPQVVFDPLEDVEAARASPELFLDHRRPPVILDEIQFAPQLVPTLKRRIDRYQGPGQYLLTGSQQWQGMRVLAESLAGRAAFVDLGAFCVPEVAGLQGQMRDKPSWIDTWMQSPEPASLPQVTRPEAFGTPFGASRSLFAQLWRGWLPAVQFLPDDLVRDFHRGYERTYVERDARAHTDLADLSTFTRFYRLAAALTAQEVNANRFGRDVGIAPNTSRRWLDILQATFQWFEISAYSGNTVKRVSGKPKGYFFDTGLCCFAQSITTPEALASHPTWGALFETAVVADLLKKLRASTLEPSVYHWRTHGGAEVDLVLDVNGRLLPFEIKASANPSRRDTRGIEAFRQTYTNAACGVILAPTAKPYRVSESCIVVPWDAL